MFIHHEKQLNIRKKLNTIESVQVLFTKSFSILFAIILAFSATHSASATGVIYTIPVGSSSEGMAYDPAIGEIFLADKRKSLVSIISEKNNARAAS